MNLMPDARDAPEHQILGNAPLRLQRLAWNTATSPKEPFSGYHADAKKPTSRPSGQPDPTHRACLLRVPQSSEQFLPTKQQLTLPLVLFRFVPRRRVLSLTIMCSPLPQSLAEAGDLSRDGARAGA